MLFLLFFKIDGFITKVVSVANFGYFVADRFENFTVQSFAIGQVIRVGNPDFSHSRELFYMVVMKIFIDNCGNMDWPSFRKGKNVSAVKWV